jgi:molybdopterin-synthase adenylyltransferase
MNTLIHEEVYRGKKLLEKMAEQHITVCGCGAVGSNLIDNMVRQGFKNLTVVDFDRIEDHNRHTQIWDKRVLGSLKVAAMKNHVFNVMSDVTFEPWPRKLDETNIKKLLGSGPSPKGIAIDTIVIDGFDNSASRKLVTEHCKFLKTDCLHIGLYKDYAEIIWNDFYKPPEPSAAADVCEYPLARNVILMATAVATDVLIRFLESGVKENYSITLKDFKIKPMYCGVVK